MKRISQLLILIFVLYTHNIFAGQATLSDRPAVRGFINMMVDKYNFNGPYLVNLFHNVKIQKKILLLMNAPKEGSPWFRYRNFFITEKRVNEGIGFWNEHENTLNLAEEKYGVSPDIIVAIIGVETNYGKVLGSYRVIDALSTLAFNYPPRQKFFRKELAEYLILAREQGFNPLAIKGSYAGAMGFPQFMPSSYRTYAVSAKGSHKVDLLNNPNDAILSVANYFKKHGWRGGDLVVSSADVDNNKYQKLLNKNFNPLFSVQDLISKGIKPRSIINGDKKANIVALRGQEHNEIWLCFNNFYVITNYNASINYAMAAYELGQEIKKKRTQFLTNNEKSTV